MREHRDAAEGDPGIGQLGATFVAGPARKPPLMAPTDVPTIRSGRIPARMSAWSCPACTAPRLPPPLNTSAVVIVHRSGLEAPFERSGRFRLA